MLPAKLLPGVNSNPTSEQVYLLTRLETLDTGVFCESLRTVKGPAEGSHGVFFFLIFIFFFFFYFLAMLNLLCFPGLFSSCSEYGLLSRCGAWASRLGWLLLLQRTGCRARAQ